MKKLFLKNYNHERKRRLNFLHKFDLQAQKEWQKNIKKLKNKSKLNEYFIFLKKMKYLNHANKVYFSHPLRVANMAFNLKKYSNSQKNLIILSLFHNIIESSNMKKVFLKKLLGKFLFKQIQVLTVNRKKEWKKNYKYNYYKNIKNHHKNTRIIKIIDKLDNLFIIGLCKNKLIRKRYITEIEEYILPMVKKDIPILSNYYKGLINQSYKLGHYDNKIKKL